MSRYSIKKRKTKILKVNLEDEDGNVISSLSEEFIGLNHKLDDLNCFVM
jgi:hypothetical protein